MQYVKYDEDSISYLFFFYLEKYFIALFFDTAADGVLRFQFFFCMYSTNLSFCVVVFCIRMIRGFQIMLDKLYLLSQPGNTKYATHL